MSNEFTPGDEGFVPENEGAEGESEGGEGKGKEQGDENQAGQEPKQNRPEETPEARKARLERQLEQHKKKHPELYRSDDTKRSKKSDGLDYGQKAFLIANGIKGEQEMGLVEEAMKRTGETLDAVLENPYFKSQLDDIRALAKTAEATPKGGKVGGTAVDSVDYWLTKPIEDVPADMRIKVVNAKLERDKSKGVFYNS